MNSKQQRTIVFKRRIQPLTKTVKETAKLIRTDVNNIRWLIDKGYIKTLKLGDTKVPVDEINRFIKYSIENNVDWNKLIEEDQENKKKVTA